ncbi:cysteine desulfurase [Candidatus Saccharibacteria bacterium]|nr:cysteine desulfurase [Candidatus Saccharibacteria bacterium]
MIYLDHAAATPMSDKALLAAEPYFKEQFFNPSSPYLPAKHVRDNYEFAKDQIAHTIGAKGADLVITAGATESINLAFTAVEAVAKAKTRKLEVLILATEHAAVMATAKSVCERTGAVLSIVNVDYGGLIDLKDFQQKLGENTVFVSVALANNELGTIQPLAEISQLVSKERERRLEAGQDLPLYLHSDASQALNVMDISVSRLGVDLLTINSAKIGGPKGVGALYVGHSVKLEPIVSGGGQELGLRSGTENVPGVIGFAAAAEETKVHLGGNRKKYQKMVEIIKNELKKCQIEPIFLGNPKHQLANFCPVSFPGIDAERLIYLLEEQEVYVSTGAACAANKGTVSHVLKAIGLSGPEIAGSLRISLGILNTEENVKKAAILIRQAVEAEAARIGLKTGENHVG